MVAGFLRKFFLWSPVGANIFNFFGVWSLISVFCSVAILVLDFFAFLFWLACIYFHFYFLKFFLDLLCQNRSRGQHSSLRSQVKFIIKIKFLFFGIRIRPGVRIYLKFHALIYLANLTNKVKKFLVGKLVFQILTGTNLAQQNVARLLFFAQLQKFSVHLLIILLCLPS